MSLCSQCSSDTYKISAIFFHVNPKSLRPSSSSPCISYLGLPCFHVPIISKRRSSSFILLLRKLWTSCIPRTKSAGKSNSYTICAKKLLKKVILRMWFSIALSIVTKLNKLKLSWSDSFIRSLISPSFSFYNCIDSHIMLCISLIFVTNKNLIISPVSLSTMEAIS